MYLVRGLKKSGMEEKRAAGGETGQQVEWVGVGKESRRSATR
jgi:hypothetical protein